MSSEISKSSTTTAGMKITAYKGFDKNWQCKGYQYEVGKAYEHTGEVSLCNSGFHVCEAPMDILDYYGLDGKIAEVELGGVTDEKEANSKRVGSSIFIKAEMTMGELISAQVEWCKKNAGGKAASSGDYSTAASSGDCSKAASSGDYSKAASNGDYSTAACGKNGYSFVAGLGGRVKGDQGSALSAGYVDQQGRRRIAVAYVGENGIQPNVWYRVGGDGNFEEAA